LFFNCFCTTWHKVNLNKSAGQLLIIHQERLKLVPLTCAQNKYFN